MNEIIEEVNASRRLKKFTAMYAMVYIILQLVLNLLYTYIPFLKTIAGNLVYKLIALIIEAPLMYGLVRGIFLKNYRVSEGFASFTQGKNYGIYGVYVVISILFESVQLLLSMAVSLANSQALNIVFSLVFLVLRLMLSFYLVRFFYDSIVLENKISLIGTFKGCVNTAKKNIGMVVSAEMFKIFAGFAALAVSSMLASILPNHEIVSPIITCFSSIQYGFIIFVWPVYYLCYKKAFEAKY